MVSEIPKKIYKMLLGLIAFSLSLTSVFATLSAVSIFSSPNNIQAGSIVEYPANNFTVSVQINNTGFYDISNVSISIRLFLYNTTYYHQLMDKSIPLGTFPAQAITPKNASFNAATDFVFPAVFVDPAITNLTATIRIDLYYIFGLMHFTAEFNQTMTDVGGFLS